MNKLEQPGKQKVWIIGLDGATWTLIDPWIEQGYLPVLKKLRTQGCWGKLNSTIQPITAPAWSSFMTGMNQGKHGLYDFVRRQAGSYNLEMTNSSMIGTPTLFDYASQAGLRVATLNMPMTFPPRPVNGIMVSGLFANVVSPLITYPSDFYKEIKHVAPSYVINPDYKPRAKDALQVYLDDLKQSLEDRYKVANYMLDLEEWDLFSLVFTVTDQVQHAFWHCLPGADVPDGYEEHPLRFGNAILDIYRRVDEMLGQLLERADRDTTVVIMSDHGAGPLHRWVQLNKWLAQEGFLQFIDDGATLGIGQSSRPKIVKNLAKAYKRYISPEMRKRIRTWLDKRFDRLRAAVESQMFVSGVDWSKTQAYSLGACGNIYVNLQGREPSGVVPQSAYEQLRNKIIDHLYTLADQETGQKLVRIAHRREDLYQGSYLENAPDIVIEWSDYRYWGRGRFDINSPSVLEARHHHDFSELPVTGTHRPEGIFLVYGAGVHHGKEIEGAHITDVAPTILYLLNQPIPREMDGHLLTTVLSQLPEHIQYTGAEIESQKEQYRYTPEDQQYIEDRLKDLGYL